MTNRVSFPRSKKEIREQIFVLFYYKVAVFFQPINNSYQFLGGMGYGSSVMLPFCTFLSKVNSKDIVLYADKFLALNNV